MYILLLAIVFIIVLLPFISKKLSPIPYFPANKQDLPLILKALNLRNGQTIIDLGAGDGVVVFKAAKEAKRRNLKTKFVAVEINPVLILILRLRSLLHPNRENIKIILADMFKLNISALAKKDITVFLYISPWFMDKVYKKLEKDLVKFELISYFYEVPGIKESKSVQGVNRIFTYLV